MTRRESTSEPARVCRRAGFGRAAGSSRQTPPPPAPSPCADLSMNIICRQMAPGQHLPCLLGLLWFHSGFPQAKRATQAPWSPGAGHRACWRSPPAGCNPRGLPTPFCYWIAPWKELTCVFLYMLFFPCPNLGEGLRFYGESNLACHFAVFTEG